MILNNVEQRLKSKSVKNAIVNNIAQDFNLTPIFVEAYFNQIITYFTLKIFQSIKFVSPLVFLIA